MMIRGLQGLVKRTRVWTRRTGQKSTRKEEGAGRAREGYRIASLGTVDMMNGKDGMEEEGEENLGEDYDKIA